MSVVSIVTVGGTIEVRTPYHPNFPPKARELGGAWDAGGKCWVFGAGDMDRVRQLCVMIYGRDGITETETCTVRIELLDRNVKDVYRFGRCLVERSRRDWNVKLGEGVSIVTGGFPSRGGSAQNPELLTYPNTILEVSGVPRSLVNGEGIVQVSVSTDTTPEQLAAIREGMATLPDMIRKPDPDKFFNVTVYAPETEEDILLITGVPAATDTEAIQLAREAVRTNNDWPLGATYCYKAVRVVKFQ